MTLQTDTRLAARVFAAAVSPGSGLALLDASLHASGRILWLQKVERSSSFLLLLQKLLLSVAVCETVLPGSGFQI